MSAAHGGPVRLAFLGCGWATRLHSRTLRRFGRDVRCWYASRSPERARAYERELGGEGSFGSYEAALEAPEIDLVLVATPPAFHLDLALRALQAGKDVIVEKPAFLRAGDCDIVGRAAGSSGRRVFVAENYFYKPLAKALRSVLASGAIGDVRLLYVNALKAQASADWRDDPRLSGGGALFEGGIHWINLVSNLGLSVVSTHGFAPGAGGGRERSALVVLRYAQGAVGALYYSWEIPSPLRGLRLSRVFGTRGSVAFESNGLFVVVLGAKRRLLFPGLSDIAGYRGMFRDFIEAWRTGRDPMMTLGHARRDLEIVEAAQRSFAAGA